MAKEPAKTAAQGAKPKGKEGKDKKAVKLDPNRFGTHAGMVVKEIKEGDKVVSIIAHDDLGHYMTSPEYVDSGMADPNRYSGSREIPKGLLDEPAEHKEHDKEHKPESK